MLPVREISACLAALALLAGGGCRGERTPAAAASDEPLPVRVLPAAVREVARVIEVPVTVVASKRAEISPEVEGVVAEVFRDLGDTVSAGEPLLRLDDEDYRLQLEQARAEHARAKAAVAEAKARLEQTRADFRRAEELRREGVLSPGQFDARRAALHVAEAAVRGAEAARDEALAAVRRAEKALRDTTVRAPFAGRVAARLVDEGALIRRMPPTVAFVLVATDPVDVEGAVGERQLARVRAGLPVEIAIDALGGSPLRGQVTAVAPSLDPVTRTAKVRVRLANPGRLRDGMTGRMRILAGAEAGLAVPRRAFLRLESGRGLLFVVGAQQRAEPREVIVAAVAPDWVTVASGLAAGEQVIVAGQGRLEGGERVVAMEGGR